jgi:hypothetical protein
MIATDGRQTIANAPVAIAPSESGRPAAKTLLERNYAGLTVEVSWHPAIGLNLFVQQGEEVGKVCTIEGGEVLDAFEHPFLYLQRAGLA